jgi:hypothetical protein
VQNHPKPRVAQLHENVKGQTATPFQFLFIVLHGRGAFFNFNPRCQLHPSSPSTSTLVIAFNFNPRRQVHPSSPSTSTLVIAFHFNPRRQVHPSSATLTLVIFYFNPRCL